MDLDQLIKGCIKKDRKSQEALYNSYKARLFPVCLKYCRSEAEAQDHLHDTFVIVFNTIKKFKGQGSFEGWMKRIAINKAIDNYKKQNTILLTDQREAILSEDIYIDENELPVSWELLMQMIQELPPQYQLIFNLYELDNYSHKEISKKLGISINTSKSNLHRAKAILKEKIINGKPDVKKNSDAHGA